MPDPKLPGLHVPARFLPVPTTISPEAQAALALPNPYGNSSAEPDAADKDAWRTRLEAMREPFLAMLQAHAAAFAPAGQTELRVGPCVLYEIAPTTLAPDCSDAALFYVHGGGFTTGGGLAAALACHALAHRTGLRTFSIDYRMPPDHPFPAGLDDAVAAYRFVLERYAPHRIAAYGPSAGAGLVASALLKARDLGLPMPAACVLHSPEADLTEAGDSFETNLGVDQVLSRLTQSIALYADGHDLTDPYLSPLYGDFSKGFPPTFLSAGTRDLFLSNTVLMHHALKKAGIPTELSIWEAMGHAGFLGSAPEDRAVVSEHIDFMLRYLRAV